MQKRRERIERWRADRKKKEIDQAKKEVQKGSLVTNIQLPTSKKWSLEDDSGDEGGLGKYFEVLKITKDVVIKHLCFMTP